MNHKIIIVIPAYYIQIQPPRAPAQFVLSGKTYQVSGFEYTTAQQEAN